MVGAEELIRDSVADGVEKAPAAMLVPPPLMVGAPRVATYVEMVAPLLVGQHRRVSRPSDVGFTRVGELGLGSGYLAVGAVDEQH